MLSESSVFRRHWIEERAYRIGMALTRAALILSLIAALIDLRYSPLWVVATDVVVFLGALVSLVLTKRRERAFVWWPVYLTYYLSTLPSIWMTGGVHSPFLGAYLAVMAVLGSVLQTRIGVVHNLVFIFLNLIGWIIVDPWVPTALTSPPTGFVGAITSISLAAIGYCVYRFLKTERDLALEIEQRYQELFQTRATLSREESANQSKSVFLANISHELRTPLGAILGYVQLLQDPATTAAERSAFAQTIERNGLQLSRLVDDLLDLSKVEAGRIEIERVECRPSELIGEILNLLGVSAKKRCIELAVNYADPIPEVVETDPVRFKQILMNVVGNALKFTHRGGVLLTVHFKDETLKISVRDTGRGITPAERDRLFKPFSQADVSMTRRYGGTGLGLSLSRKLARLMGGNLDLTWSQPGLGSEFTLSLPVKFKPAVRWVTKFEEPGVGPINMAGVERTVDFRDRRILVVDDSADNRDLIRRYLAPTGAIVDEACDGGECIQKAEVQPYDIVLMDIQMPGLDGLEATSVLRRKSFHSPIVALTAHAMKSDRERCLHAGCDDHVSKPVLRAELMNVIERHLSIVRS